MKQLISELFKQGNTMGFTDMEIITNENDSFEVKIYEQQIDSYKVTDSKGMGFRGMYKGKMGYSYTEKLAEDSIEILLKSALENAEINDSVEQDEIFEGSKEYVETDNYFPKLDEITVAEKIEFAKRMESIAKSLDKRVKSCPYCIFGSGTGKSGMVNTKRLDVQDKGNAIYCFVEALAQQGEDLSDGFAFCFENDFSLFDPEKIAKEAVDKAIAYLGTKPIKTGNYKAIILNTVSGDILSAIRSCFSARTVQKGMSFLKGKLDTKVASDLLTIADDPFLVGKSGTASFDGEGVATRYKEVIKDGVLKTYLHNMKTARIDKTESTGNASRSYKSNIGIAPSNLYIKNGNITLNEMEAQMDNGIVITDVSALHSGFDAISGDFSLPAKGYTVKNGVLDRYFRQVTVSGNYFEILKNITQVASDLSFGSNGNIGSPSIMISNISVAGE